MKGSEQALLGAVRTWLRTATGSGGAGYSNDQCDIQFDEYAAAIAPDVFVCITPGGIRQGDTHNTNASAWDILVDVNITIFRRMTWIARDRKQNVYLLGSTTLQDDVDKIMGVVDWSYSIQNTANTTLAAAPYSSSYGFVEPLRFGGMGPTRPMLSKEAFHSASDKEQCMVRTINFRSARRMMVKT